MPISNNVRRVVTTVDESGKAVVLFDGDNPHNIKRPDRPNTSRPPGCSATSATPTRFRRWCDRQPTAWAASMCW